MKDNVGVNFKPKEGGAVNHPDWRNVQVASTNEENVWITLSPMFYELKDGRTVCIRAGFKTDLASIPRCLWNLYPPFDVEYRAAAILHDGLYASELLTRQECDWLLLEAMQTQGNGWWARNVFWSAVRLGGASVWSKHTGESRTEARRYVSIIPAEGLT